MKIVQVAAARGLRACLLSFTVASVLSAAPMVKLISPVITPDEGWTVHKGVIAFAAHATSSSGSITRVEFYVDNTLRNTDTTYPYGYIWDNSGLANGTHTLKVVAVDGAGSTTVQQNVILANPVPKKTPTGSVVTAGLLPASVQPIIDGNRMRDVSVCRGDDGAWYLTGTGSDEDAWHWNEGINLWRSTDLSNWTYLGLVWSFERDGTTLDKTWSTNSSGKPIRSVWAPEICYIKGNYYILWSFAGRGTYILRSSSGQPSGPYVNNKSDGSALFNNIDGSLFEDDNGTVWLCYENGNIWQMNSTLTGTIGSVFRMGQGDEGGFLFKYHGKYYLCVGKFMASGQYSSYVGIASAVTGPYSQWHEAIACGGHNSYFRDGTGTLWGTIWGNDKQCSFNDRAAVVKMQVNADGTLKPNSDQSRPGASTVYQGESATYGGGVTIDTNNAVYNGTGFANFPPLGGYLQFNNVSGGTGGSKVILFRYALGVATSRTGRLLINGIPQNMTFSPTGSWSTWTTLSVTVSLNANTTNTIRLESSGQDLGNIDELQVP